MPRIFSTAAEYLASSSVILGGCSMSVAVIRCIISGLNLINSVEATIRARWLLILCRREESLELNSATSCGDKVTGSVGKAMGKPCKLRLGKASWIRRKVLESASFWTSWQWQFLDFCRLTVPRSAPNLLPLKHVESHGDSRSPGLWETQTREEVKLI